MKDTLLQSIGFTKEEIDKLLLKHPKCYQKFEELISLLGSLQIKNIKNYLMKNSYLFEKDIYIIANNISKTFNIEQNYYKTIKKLTTNKYDIISIKVIKMIYYDNAATTKVDKEVLDTFIKVSNDYIGNPNSIHKLGFESKKLMNAAIKQVANLLNVKEDEIIFTSSSSESNNLAIKGVLASYPKRKKIILTTILEHPSITNTLNNLKDIEIINLKLDNNYHIDINDLKEKLKLDPILVSIHHINSELGIIQDIDTIGKIIKENSKAIFHVDGTQSLTKIDVNLNNVDLFSASAHKFNGLKGIAILIKKEKITLTPLIHGGSSQSIYRAGTPSPALIASFAKALRLSLQAKDKAYLKVKEINKYLKEELNNIKNITINSKQDSSPYIINFSIKGIKPETMIHKLEEKEVYLSTKTACSSKEDYSKSIYLLTNNLDISKTSLRLSLSKDNTLKEAKEFIKILNESL